LYPPSAADPHEDKGDGLELPALGGSQRRNDASFLAARSITTMLAKDPAMRYQTPGQAGGALRSFLASSNS
jgi:hypothetical protein